MAQRRYILLDNVDRELYRRMKVLAAEAGLTLRAWCPRVFVEAEQQQAGKPYARLAPPEAMAVCASSP
jgi:hypothetical protein